MRMDADSDEKGHGDDYGADCGHYGADYDGADDGDWSGLRDDRAYWRRRFVILCGGVAALGVCAWLLPSAHQPSKREVAAASASMSALARHQALPSSATGSSWQGGSMPDVYPTASAQVANTAKSTPKPRTAYHQKPAPSASPPPAKAGACAPADIVLSLFTSQPSYAKGAHPSFSVYAVSTKAAACTLTYGAGSVQVVVTREGHVVWDSAACKTTPVRSVRFTLGVPQVLTMVWDPAVREPAGCAGSLAAGASGTLDAVAMSHGQSSPVRAFRLNR
jgi:hypothetical protein